MIGRRIRLNRIIDRASGKALIIPMDHGVTMGPLNGLIDMRAAVDDVAEGGATAVIMHKGMIGKGYRDHGRDVGLVMHLSASTDIGSNRKTVVSGVEEAIKMGADAVSVHLNLGGDDERKSLNDVGVISEQCSSWGMPLIVMSYPSDVSKMYDRDTIAHCARVASELGADIVKVPYTGDRKSFRYAVEGAAAPVVVAGGPKMSSDSDFLNMVHGAMEAGCIGVSAGRNVFQHEDVRKMTAAVRSIVFDGTSVADAIGLLR